MTGNSPAAQASDVYLRTLMETTRITQAMNDQMRSFTDKLRAASPFASLAKPPTPTAMPLPKAERLPVGAIIAPVRLVRFESQAYGQLQSLIGRAGLAGGIASGKAGSGFQNPFKPLAIAAAATTASLVGLAKAGLSGTVEGYRLDMQFTLLSRSVASIFLPVIESVTQRMEKLNFALMNLTGNQQNKLMKVGLGVAGVGAFAGGLSALSPIIGPIVGMFTGLIPPLMSLAGIGGPVTIVLGAVAVAVAAAGAGFAYLAIVSKPVQNALKEVWGGMKQLWAATEPLRAALLDLGATLATHALEEMAKAMAAVANDKEVVAFLKDMANAIKDVAAAVPGFVADLKGMAVELRREAVAGKERFLAAMLGEDGMRARADAIAGHNKEIQRAQDLKDQLVELHKRLGPKLLQGDNFNPFKARTLPRNKRMTPTNHGV